MTDANDSERERKRDRRKSVVTSRSSVVNQRVGKSELTDTNQIVQVARSLALSGLPRPPTL